MNQSGPPPLELVASLAEEIGQAIDWLRDPPGPLSNQKLRLRIQTLREAARVTGMNAVESVLDAAERELGAGGSAADEAVGEGLLVKLGDLANSLAGTIREEERHWFERIQTASAKLDEIASGARSGSEQLRSAISLAESLAIETRPGERSRLAGLLMVELSELQTGYDAGLDKLRRIAPELQETMYDLSSQICWLRNASIVPLLARLRRHVRDQGRDLGKPVSLVAHCANVRVAPFQLEPLEAVLVRLLDEAMKTGIESPRERRRSGKATVGSLSISGGPTKSIISLSIKDDGGERPPPTVTRELGEQLGALRARLLMITPPHDEAAPQAHGRELLLQLPVWREIIDVIPVETSVGRLLVPLDVVGEVFGDSDDAGDGLPVVSLARRANDRDQGRASGSGLIFDVGDWRAVMYAEVLGAHRRVLQARPQADDPAWASGRICADERSLPILHPLPFMEIEEGQLCLYPNASP